MSRRHESRPPRPAAWPFATTPPDDSADRLHSSPSSPVSHTFRLETDREVVVAFEPTAAEFTLDAGAAITVRWHGPAEDGVVAYEVGQLVVHAPTGGYTRVWDQAGVEIYIGPESGTNAS